MDITSSQKFFRKHSKYPFILISWERHNGATGLRCTMLVITLTQPQTPSSMCRLNHTKPSLSATPPSLTKSGFKAHKPVWEMMILRRKKYTVQKVQYKVHTKKNYQLINKTSVPYKHSHGILKIHHQYLINTTLMIYEHNLSTW